MYRLLLVPLVAIGVIILLTGKFGAGALPSVLLGVPTPMVLFIGLSVFILSMLRTT